MTCSAVPPKLVTYISLEYFLLIKAFFDKNSLNYIFLLLHFLLLSLLSLTQIYGKAYFRNAIKITSLFCQATIKVIKNNFYLLCSQPLQSSLLDIVLFSVSLILFLTSMFYILSYFFRFFKRFEKFFTKSKCHHDTFVS